MLEIRVNDIQALEAAERCAALVEQARRGRIPWAYNPSAADIHLGLAGQRAEPLLSGAGPELLPAVCMV